MERIFVIISMLALVLSGCGDLNDGKAMNPDRVIAELQATNCEVNTKNLEKILSEPIPNEINCIYDQLNVLMKLVRTERPELGGKNITRATLETFIRKYVPNAVEALDYFDMFFTLNGFIFGVADDILIQEDFRRLRDFLLMMNREVSEIYPYLEKLGDDERIGIKFHQNIKEQKIIKTFDYIVNGARTKDGEDISLLGLLEVRPTTQRSMDITRLVGFFENDDNGETIEEIKAFVFLKRVIFGGSKNIINNTEFANFLRNQLKSFLSSFYDVYRHPNLSFDSESKRYELYGENIENIKNLIFNAGEESLVDFSDLFNLLNIYREDILGKYSELDFHTLGLEVLRIKQILIGQSKENLKEIFTYQDFQTLLLEGSKVVERSRVNSIIFNENRDYLLNEKGKIVDDRMIRTSVNRSSDDFLSFMNTIKRYRYFKGNNELPFYGDDIHRNIETINLIGALDYAADKIYRFYENEYPCHSSEVFDVWNFKPTQIHSDHRCKGTEDNNATLNAGQLIFVVQEFRKILYETKIIGETREDKAGENVMNIPDLFMETGNDDGFSEPTEFIEFVLSLFDSMGVRKKVMPIIQENCPVVDELPEFGGERFLTKCVRDQFYGTLSKSFEDEGKIFRYFDSLPKFEEKYLDWKSYDDADRRLRRYTLLLEGFTKVCAPYDNIPYSEADIMGLYTSIFTVESTFNKFDLNGDNKIDKHESKKAYQHFERGLKSILDTMINGIKLGFLSKNFFKFLVDKKRAPLSSSAFFKDVGDVLNVLLIYNFKPFPEIDREKIITVLTTLQDTGEPKRKKRLGDAYEDKETFCGRTNNTTTFERNEWKCYVEGKQDACEILEP